MRHYFGHISGIVGPIDVKWEGSALVGYWIWYVTLTFDLTHNIDLGCFKVKFRNSCISGIVGRIDVNLKGSELIRYWTDYMTLLFDHTHHLDLGVSRSESEIAVSQEWDGRLTWDKQDVNHPLMTMIFTNRILGWLYDFALWSHPSPWPWSFMVRVWNSLISGMGWLIDMEQKGWPGWLQTSACCRHI